MIELTKSSIKTVAKDTVKTKIEVDQNYTQVPMQLLNLCDFGESAVR